MIRDFNSKEWDKEIAQYARKRYVAQQLKRTAATVSVFLVALGLGVQMLGTQVVTVAETETLDTLIDQQVVAVYESAVQSEDNLLIWDF